MLRRSSSTLDPKIKKCCKVSQQTESMEDTAENEEKVMLDYFNLVKIASFTKLNCTPSICQELVSKTFASALRSFYSSKKFKLSIGTSDPKGLMKTDPNIVYLSISNKKKISLLCEESIMIKKENLKQAIVQVFVRFPRINLKLAAEYIEDIAFIVGDALNIAHDMTIESLRVYFHYVNMTGCRELIEKLSGNLQVLTLVFFDSNVDEVDESMSEQLWQAVSSCPKLVELSVMFDNDLILLEEHPVLMHIVDCLKPLKINYFRTNLREVKADRLDGGMEWLCSALVENEKLRHLNLDLYTEGCYLGDLGDGDDALKVLGRLDSLKISNADVRNAPNKWRSSLRKILPALSEHAVLKITGYCDVEMESSAYATSKTLNMYLKLSHLTAKSIKLRLSFDSHMDVATIFNEALVQLSRFCDFPGLQAVSIGSWTRLLFGNANFMVKMRDMLNG